MQETPTTYVETVFAPYTGNKTYTYKTTDYDAEPGDYFAVQTPNGALQIVKVLKQVQEPKYKCKWAFQKIDLRLLTDLEATEPQDAVKLARL
tara:strand:- start:1839 stop:2114 length:276 start_codon:yes stop_codon:yes gene_type:complete